MLFVVLCAVTGLGRHRTVQPSRDRARFLMESHQRLPQPHIITNELANTRSDARPDARSDADAHSQPDTGADIGKWLAVVPFSTRNGVGCLLGSDARSNSRSNTRSDTRSDARSDAGADLCKDRLPNRCVAPILTAVMMAHPDFPHRASYHPDLRDRAAEHGRRAAVSLSLPPSWPGPQIV